MCEDSQPPPKNNNPPNNKTLLRTDFGCPATAVRTRGRRKNLQKNDDNDNDNDEMKMKKMIMLKIRKGDEISEFCSKNACKHVCLSCIILHYLSIFRFFSDFPAVES